MNEVQDMRVCDRDLKKKKQQATRSRGKLHDVLV